MMLNIAIFLIGLSLGACIGAAIMGWVLAARMSDLQERLDAWEMMRWRHATPEFPEWPQ